MNVHPYYGPGNVVIDTCSRCDLVWLDFGELQQISDAPGQDRGRPAAQPSYEDRSGQPLERPSEGRRISIMDTFGDVFGSE
jgi:Zn-finger nucleic acid-binding protein